MISMTLQNSKKSSHTAAGRRVGSLLFGAAVIGAIILAAPAQAAVVINEVYGGGGSTTATATYKSDFIELYNNGTAAADISGYSIQYASATGAFPATSTTTAGNVGIFPSGTIIPPGKYFLIRGSTSTGGADLPTADFTTSLSLAAASGKVVLANNNSQVTFTAPNTFTSGNVVDFVGYGTASAYEGTGPAPANSITISAVRSKTGLDTNSNATDFIAATPSAQNSSSAAPATIGAKISEFRISGPTDTTDDFVEVYNNTSSPLDITGWQVLSAGTVVGTIPAGKTIPGRTHLLLASSNYSLTSVAAADVALSGDVTADALTLVNPFGVTIDAVNSASLPTPAAGSNYSYARIRESGVPQDSDNDAADFDLVSTAGTTGPATGSAAETAATGTERLGAPGPQNLSSPIQRNGSIPLTLADAAAASNTANNQVRNQTPVANGTLGTLSLRRTLTNNTTGTITRLRLRAVGATSGATSPSGVADVRLLTSPGTTITVNGTVIPVSGLTLEEPPTQSQGGGLNSTLVANLSTGIPKGSTFTVEILLGVNKSGIYRIAFDFEAATG